MNNVIHFILLLHVAVGFAGLAAFWVPIFTRKGGTTHRLFGRIYKYCAYIVMATAGAAVIVRSAQYLLAGESPATRPAQFGFLLFLGYLAWTTFVIVHHGVGVLAHKTNPGEMHTPLNVFLARSAIAASVAVVAYAGIVTPPNLVILFALSPIGLLSGLGMLRYFRNPPSSSRQWMYEHLGSMIGGGIAFHTAFTVFGAGRIFDLNFEGWVAVVPWIAPAAIGIPATILWTRHYRRKFAEL